MSARLIFSHPDHPPLLPSIPCSTPSSTSRQPLSFLLSPPFARAPSRPLRFRYRGLSPHGLFFTAVISRFSLRQQPLLSFLAPFSRGPVVSHLRRRGVRHVRITPSTTTRSLIIRTPVCRDAVFPGSVESSKPAIFCLLRSQKLSSIHLFGVKKKETFRINQRLHVFY